MTTKKNTPEKLRPFLFHGVDISSHPKQAEGTCPFCDKENHFHVETATGRWHCKRCSESGNIPTFLVKLLEYSHDNIQEALTMGIYEALTEDRNIPIPILFQWGVIPSFITGDWLLPAFNPKGKLANIFKATQDREGKWKVLSSPGCKLHPFGIDQIIKRKGIDTLWVCEGPWDAMALYAALASIRQNGDRFTQLSTEGVYGPAGDSQRANRGKEAPSTSTQKGQTPQFNINPKSLLATHAVIGVPGAGSFNEDWLTYLEDKKVRLIYDNDHPKQTPSKKRIKPGWDGMKRVIDLAGDNGRIPRAMYRIRWGKQGYDPKLADGYDVRDLLSEQGPIKGIKTALALMERVKVIPSKESEEDPIEQIEPLERTSFKALVKDYESTLHFTQPLKDTLAIMLATVVSTPFPEDQLWFRIIGPPGSGKTTLAEAISAARDQVFPISNITGIHSGFVGGGRSRGKDASLIPKMEGKTTVMKDADMLITAPNMNKILGEMRDIFDEVSRADYRNRVSKSYENVKSTFILCGTDELRKMNNTPAGERFLDCEIFGDTDRKPYVQRAIKNAFTNIFAKMENKDDDNEVQDEDKMTFLKRATKGFIIHLCSNLIRREPPEVAGKVVDQIEALAGFLSLIRARVNRDKGDLLHRSRVELGTRPSKQLVKLSICLAIVMEKKRIDRDIIRIVRKVVRDTAESYQLEVVNLLHKYKSKNSGLAAKQIEYELKISEGSIRRMLGDMQEFGIIQRIQKSNPSGQRGRNTHLWQLTDNMKALHKQAFRKV